MQIGSFVSANPIFTAPMAGITDRPFRDILHRMGGIGFYRNGKRYGIGL